MDDHAHRAGLALNRSRQWMGCVRFLPARCGGRGPHQHSAVLNFYFVARHGVILEPRLTAASDAMELPVVPWTDDIIAIQPTLTQRSTGVVTDAGDDAEHAIAMGNREFAGTKVDFS